LPAPACGADESIRPGRFVTVPGHNFSDTDQGPGDAYSAAIFCTDPIAPELAISPTSASV
jgi:hypothetical protein